MAHNDKPKNTPLVILPFVLLSLCLGVTCTLSMHQARASAALAMATKSKARIQTIDFTARIEAGENAAG
jgi:hypothetical protein